jgi:hypothetical protein
MYKFIHTKLYKNKFTYYIIVCKFKQEKIGKIYMFLTCGQLNIAPKNSCANPTLGMLAVKIYTSQQDYPKSTRFCFVAVYISQQKTEAVQISHAVFLLLKYHAHDDYPSEIFTLKIQLC